MARRQRPKAKTAVDPTKVAAKKARRLERQRQEEEAKARAQRRRRLRMVIGGAAGAVALAAVVFFIVRPDPELPGVERPPNLGRDHLVVGESVTYASATPTSGPHAPNSPGCGIMTTPLALELAVHALEHGVVVVWHSLDLAQPQLDELYALAREQTSHVIVSPNPGITEPIVATAWNRLARYDAPGDDLAEFIDVYRERGPEKLPCPL